MCQQQKVNGGKYAFTSAHAQIILIIGNSRASQQGKICIWLTQQNFISDMFFHVHLRFIYSCLELTTDAGSKVGVQSAELASRERMN